MSKVRSYSPFSPAFWALWLVWGILTQVPGTYKRAILIERLLRFQRVFSIRSAESAGHLDAYPWFHRSQLPPNSLQAWL